MPRARGFVVSEPPKECKIAARYQRSTIVNEAGGACPPTLMLNRDEALGVRLKVVTEALGLAEPLTCEGATNESAGRESAGGFLVCLPSKIHLAPGESRS